MPKHKSTQNIRPFRKSLVLIVVGLYVTGFLLQSAAAAGTLSECGDGCCCKTTARSVKVLSGQNPCGGCCSGSSAPTCHWRDDAGMVFPQFAVHHQQSPGKRLSSWPIAIGPNPSCQQMQVNAWRQDNRLSNRRPGPIYLEKQSLLC